MPLINMVQYFDWEVSKNKFEKTNQNRLDLWACWSAVEYAFAHKVTRPIIYIDSTYVFYAYVKKRIHTALRFDKDIANLDLWVPFVKKCYTVKPRIEFLSVGDQEIVARVKQAASDYLYDELEFDNDEKYEYKHV